MMQEVEVLKTIQELICSFFSEEQFTLSVRISALRFWENDDILYLDIVCIFNFAERY